MGLQKKHHGYYLLYIQDYILLIPFKIQWFMHVYTIYVYKYIDIYI
jgi:hypothetical protein